MDQPKGYDNWPDYLPGPRDDLIALGVISLNYGRLENIFRIIFAMATGMAEGQVSAIFERISNRQREDIFYQLVGTQAFPDGLTKLIEHFMDGYGICADNRNSVMHAHHGGIHAGLRGTQGIVLTKYSRSGERLSFFAHTAALREIADAIDGQCDFGASVMLAIQAFNLCRSQNRIVDFGKSPLPDKPPLPVALNWLSHPVRQDDPRLLESSQE